ncbi:MAG: NADH-quinone oxidoreductase subunit L [Micrococcales bacterium]|nr:NADH-quinone oxidoreductase subunit L [Micrococcales bacterium]
MLNSMFMSTEPIEPISASLPATGPASLIWLCVAIPLVSAGLLLVMGRRSNPWGHWLGVLASSSTFVVGVAAFFQLLGLDAAERSMNVKLFTFLPAIGPIGPVEAGMQVDQLSITFVLLVSFVGSLIHIYSVAYMDHDPDRRRFFAYLNLFVASMLLLVLGNSYLLLFIGWEGVGLASYLLIGFWNHRDEYAVAAKKAFVVNRVGDIGLLVAMMLMFANFHAVGFTEVFAQAPEASSALVTGIGIMLLLAACGKSAQFPLQSWLGDAMAGPTPVSALIHAATMVTAGVYLVVRSGPIYAGAPNAKLAVVVIGAITLLYGAIVGCAKDDMKKALAASTMSQIGYMMLAAGLGPVGAAFAIMHLLTHGFFKAGMFLGAGSVMHGMNDEVDMRRFGAVRSAMMVTYVTFGLGWLAILGLPPFAGFFSKDKIIEAAFEGTGWQPWVFGFVTMIGAGITAFYMSRLFFMVFHGQARWDDGVHPHESPALMTVPMMILALGSVSLGFILWLVKFPDWLAPITDPHHHHAEAPVLAVPVITGVTLALVLIGGFLAWTLFGTKKAKVPKLPPAANGLVKAARLDLYQDQVNHGLFVIPGQGLINVTTAADTHVVDGSVRGLGWLISRSGQVVRRLQTGYARSYAATMVAGMVILLAIVLAVVL